MILYDAKSFVMGHAPSQGCASQSRSEQGRDDHEIVDLDTVTGSILKKMSPVN